MQRLQTELKIQWKFASQATPSPKAKATMETLDRTRSDLSYHYDSVVESLKRLQTIRSADKNTSDYGERVSNVDNGNVYDESQQSYGICEKTTQNENANIQESKNGKNSKIFIFIL